MLDGQFVSTQLIGPFISIRAGLRHVKAERYTVATWCIAVFPIAAMVAAEVFKTLRREISELLMNILPG